MLPRVICTRLLVTFSLFCGAWLSQCCFASPFGRGSVANPPQQLIDEVTDIVARKWLESYSIGGGIRVAGTLNFTTKIEKLQRLAGIKVTGKLDDETKKLFIIPRCGVLEEEDNPQRLNDTETDVEVTPYRRKRFYLQGTYWNKKDLTYRFLSSTPDLPVDVQRVILRKMINKWAEASTLTIREADLSIPDDDVDILISFVRGYHGDPYPFDGTGGTLAHAFYPHNNRGLSGDAHFDDDEYFTTGTPEGINLDWVAVHEFGHSMGLEHSNVRESIMYPWYKGYFENIELTYDDIKGIQALYGKPTPTPATTKRTTAITTKATTAKASTTKATTTKTTTIKASTTRPTTTKTTTIKASTTRASTTKTTTTKASSTKTTATEAPTTRLPVLDVCKVERFDAFLMGTDRKTYVFSGHYFWVLGVRLGLESGPIKITSRWKELKTPISSAYTNWDGRTVFFKGSEYWKYSGYRLEEGPRDITKYGLPSELQNPDAAFIWPGNNKAYFFKGFNYWRYNEIKRTVDDSYPRPISIWALDHSIDSVMSWSRNKRTYFFKGFNYWKVYNDSYPISMAPGYPRDITQIWMKCAT